MPINTYQESQLHAALKQYYARPQDKIEAVVEGFIIDILSDDGLVEIQTGSFSALKYKFSKLLDRYPIRLIHPIAIERFIVKVNAADGEIVSRRRSPKKGRVENLFDQLLYIRDFLSHSHFSLEIALIRDEEVQHNDGGGSWRRKGWRIHERHLLEVVECQSFITTHDYLRLLPAQLPDQFTTADIAQLGKMPRRTAQKMAYCLKHLDLIRPVAQQGKAIVYVASP